MNPTRHTRLALIAAFFLQPSSLLLSQGPLIPPGAPAPTMKTLDQVEPRTPISSLPFTISASGSYYLTGSVIAPADTNGITINASNVTLDLRGFEVAGTPGTAAFGIRISTGISNVVIRDGTVRNWPGSGVVVENTAVSRVRVENVRANNNSGTGIALGIDSVVVDCTANGNGANGISGLTGCQVLRSTANGQTGTNGFSFGAQTVMADCIAKANAVDGIVTGQDSVLSGCLADGNAGVGFLCANRTVIDRCLASNNGLTGFRTLFGCSVTNSAANANLVGLFAQSACTLQNFSAFNNSGDGIQAGTAAVVMNCVAASNRGAFGILAGNGSTVAHCSVSLNTSTAATSAGISASTGCSILDCTVADTNSTAATLTASTGMGITVSNGSTVERCTVRNSRGDGIRASVDCRIVGNACETNGLSTGDGAGIHVTATGNRIDSNHVMGNDRGIDVDSVANTIVRNTATGNPVNYDMVGGNSVGAIVIPGNSVLINTNVAQASSLGTTDPWANFSE